MIRINTISYTNEKGELITVNFENTRTEDMVDRVTDLMREASAGGREMGPPPQPVVTHRNPIVRDIGGGL